MRRLISFISLPLLLAISACGAAPETMPVPGGRGGHRMHLASPQRLTQGEYLAPVFANIETVEAGQTALKSDRSKPLVDGPVGGVLVTPSTADLPLVSCANKVSTLFGTELPAASIPEFGYLPPGAHELEAPMGSACGDNLIFTQRRITLLPDQSEIVVVKRFNTKTVRAQTSLDRVRITAVNGIDMVVVDPVIPQGWGNSWVFVTKGSHVLQVTGINVPASELIKTAEQISW